MQKKIKIKMRTKTKVQIITVFICVLIHIICHIVFAALGLKVKPIYNIPLFIIYFSIWKKASQIGEEKDCKKNKEDDKKNTLIISETSIYKEELENILPNSENEDLPPIPQQEKFINLELNNLVKNILKFWVVLGTIGTIVLLINNEETFIANTINTGVTLLMLTGIIGMILKKRWGLLLHLGLFFLRLIMYIFIALDDSFFINEVLKLIITEIIFCSFLFPCLVTCRVSLQSS